jgi:hypothetical protein
MTTVAIDGLQDSLGREGELNGLNGFSGLDVLHRLMRIIQSRDALQRIAQHCARHVQFVLRAAQKIVHRP